MVAFVFVHSPLVGPMTWRLVATELQQEGYTALVPSLFDAPQADRPYWQQHAQSVAQAVSAAGVDEALVLVAHSGAGPLLPAIRQALTRPVVGYIFVDAGLPQDKASRLDLFGSPEGVAAFREAAVGGLLPPWTDDDLREVIPDDALRQRFVAELRPLPLAVYEEPLPVFAGWPDAPCGYVQFSPVYDAPAQQAQAQGWPYLHLPGGHFHMLVEPKAIADTLLHLTHAMGVPLH